MKTIIMTVSMAVLLMACSDDSSSTSATKDASVSSIDELGNCNSDNRGESKYVEEKDDYYICVGGEWVAENEYSKYADAITSSSSNSSGKSSESKDDAEEVSIYTTATSTLTITLTSYTQLKAMDEKDEEDGEPRISFIVKTNKDGISQKDSIKTEKISLGNDIGFWSGSKELSISLSKDINIIHICPVFVDEDAFFDDKEYTSNACYVINDVGQKIGKIIQQADTASAYYTMNWDAVIEY